MSSKNSNKLNIPEAKAAMNKFKMEAASEVGVNLKQGYNGDLTSREAGSVGGQIVKKMIERRQRARPTGRAFFAVMDEMTEDILQSLPARSLRAGIFSIPARRRQKGKGLAALGAHFAQFICKNTLLHFLLI